MLKNIFKAWLTFKWFIKELFDHDPMTIKPYLSYANADSIRIKGRVLEDEGEIDIENRTMLDNLAINLKSFAADRAKYAKVIVSYEDEIIETYTDADGYFNVDIPIAQKPTNREFLDWASAQVLAPEYTNNKGDMINAKINILLPHSDTEYIIVSDIDDTVLVTHVNSFLKLKLLYNTLFKNERSRTPFEDIADVLHELTLNNEGYPVNPIFYLSNSPWNLYEFLTNFLKFQNIPLGPLFLRDFGIKFGKKRRAYKNHKSETLQHLLEFYKEHQFILLGDATEGDTDIYLEAYRQNPNRIAHIYIRSAKEKLNQRVLKKIEAHPSAPIHLINHSSDILRYQSKFHRH
ncbi:MAG: phosphatase domain-containing protein [Weeksellaceae bacterium]